MDRARARLETKVQSGERLEPDELARVEQAAKEEPGARWRLLLAHALINQDSAKDALVVLDGLARDFPRDAQVPLARARALVTLERFTEAEPLLARALELQPDDPEALKAAATLALRRGEVAKARTLAERVLQVDPLDGEARALLGALDDAAPAGPKEVVLLPDFTRALVDRLKRASTPHLLQKGNLLVRLGRGGVARLDLSSLYRSFLDAEQPVEAAVEAIASELAERALEPRSKVALLATVLPVVRDDSFLDRAVGAARREGPAGLFVFYTPLDPQMVRYVPEGALQSLRVTLQELDEAAWKNLDATLADPLPMVLEPEGLRLGARPAGLWALAKGDGHDGARLLSPAQQQRLAAEVGPQPWRVYLGLRELVLLAREGSREAGELETLEPAKDGIRGVFRLEGGRLTELPKSTAWSGV